MDENRLIAEIKNKNIDVEYFANQVIKDEDLRRQIVKYLLTNRDIMVYYHCYYIVSEASEVRPELFFEYWNEFVLLLNHKNSYHRDIGLTIIANLVRVDVNHLFDVIFKDYLRHADDVKFMTGSCCIRNLVKIVQHRKDLRETIMESLLQVDEQSSYPEKQKELLKYDILEVLDVIYEESDTKVKLNAFIKNAASSISPKTRKKAQELFRKYLVD